MPRHRNNPSKPMNNQGDKAAQEENEQSPENKFKDIEIHNLKDREFTSEEIIHLKNSMRCKKLRQFDELRNKVNKYQ